MTTIVTVSTHANPVLVTIHAGGDGERSPTRRSYDYGNTSEYLAADSLKDFTISGAASLNVSELPEEARDLDHADELRSNDGSAGITRIG